MTCAASYLPNEIETKIRVEVGEPAEEIVNAASDYDLVVMGTRGFGGLDEENNFVGGKNAWK